MFQYLNIMYLKNINKYHEVNQSLIRFVLVCIIIFYAHLSRYLDLNDYSIEYLSFLYIYIFISLAEILWSINNYCNENVTFHRILFRITANIIDNALLAFAMIKLGYTGTPLVFIYLWVTFGIGIRYGVQYLLISAILNIISFSFVIYLSPVWHNNTTILISIGLLISLIILPSYVYILILKLTKALDAEQKANNYKKIFLANFNHELRTPVNSILNIIDLIRGQKNPSNLNHMLNMINYSSISLLQSINGILNLSKLEANKYVLEFENFNFYSLIHQIINVQRPQAINKGIDLHLYIDPRCESNLFGACEELKIIINNLISNAIKFTEFGNVFVDVGVGKDDKYNQEIILKVKDTGIGIPVNKQDEIFKPFVQADTSISRKYGGTGLGISIASKLSMLMGGRISLESEQNIGTTFTFYFKLVKRFDNYNTSNNDNKDLNIIAICDFNKNLSIINQLLSCGYSVNRYLKNNMSNYIDDSRRNIILIDSDNYEGKIKNLIKNPFYPKIAIYSNDEYKKNNKYAITSVNEKFDNKNLLNAIKICSDALLSLDQKKLEVRKTSKPIKILIAEDDPILLETHKLLFSCTEHQVDYVTNGRQVLDYVNNSNYDIAILDLHMPEYSGIDVARLIKEDLHIQSLPIILLTADIHDMNSATEFRELFDELLLKPASLNDILNCISKVLGLEDEAHQRIEDISNKRENNLEHTEECLLDYKVIDEHINIAGLTNIVILVTKYNQEVHENLEKLSNEIKRENVFEVKKVLHKLQGTSFTIGALKFGKNVTQLKCDIGKKNEIFVNNISRKTLIDLHNETISQMSRYLKEVMEMSRN